MDNDKRKILEELGGIPEDVYDGLVKEFLEDSKKSSELLLEAIDRGDITDAARIAHTIKGASGNLRLYPIQEAARSLEKSIKDNAGADAVKASYRALCDSIKKYTDF